MVCKYFFPFCRLPFYCGDCLFCYVWAFLLWCSLSCLFSFCVIHEIISKTDVMKLFPYFLLEVLQFQVLVWVFLICFELIFVNDIRQEFSSFFCMWISSFPNAICWRYYHFPTVYSWHSCSWSVDYVCVDWFCRLAFLSILYCFDNCNFVICFEIRICGAYL